MSLGLSVGLLAAAGADVTAPLLVSITIAANGLTGAMLYDELLDETSVPVTTNFNLQDTPATVSGVGISGDTVTLTFDEPISEGDVPLVDYAPSGNPIRDLAENNAANLSSEPVTNNSTVFDPRDLGDPLSWMQGDHVNNVMQGTGELPYDSLFDRGSLGGTFDSATNAAPVSVDIDTLNAPTFREERLARHSLAASNFAYQHNGTDDCSESFSIYLHEVTEGAVIYSTFDGDASGIGFLVQVSGGVIEIVYGNGTATTTVTSLTPLSATTHYPCIVTKSGASVGLSVGGETVVPGTISSPSASDPDHAPVLGNAEDGSASLDGILPEYVSHPSNIGAGRSDMDAWFASRWNATPTNSAIQHRALYSEIDFDRGYTLDSGDVSDINDQSGKDEHLAQGTGSARLAHTASDSDFEGRGSVQGAAGDYIGRATWLSGAHSNVTTQYLVIKTPATVPASQFVTRGATARNDVFLNITGSGHPSLFGGGILTAGGKYLSTVQIIVATFNGATLSRIQVHADGEVVLDMSGNGGTIAGNGRYLCGNAGASSFTGKLSRVLDYDDDFNSDVLDLLKTEYGITTS